MCERQADVWKFFARAFVHYTADYFFYSDINADNGN